MGYFSAYPVLTLQICTSVWQKGGIFTILFQSKSFKSTLYRLLTRELSNSQSSGNILIIVNSASGHTVRNVIMTKEQQANQRGRVRRIRENLPAATHRAMQSVVEHHQNALTSAVAALRPSAAEQPSRKRKEEDEDEDEE